MGGWGIGHGLGSPILRSLRICSRLSIGWTWTPSAPWVFCWLPVMVGAEMASAHREQVRHRNMAVSLYPGIVHQDAKGTSVRSPTVDTQYRDPQSSVLDLLGPGVRVLLARVPLAHRPHIPRVLPATRSPDTSIYHWIYHGTVADGVTLPRSGPRAPGMGTIDVRILLLTFVRCHRSRSTVSEMRIARSYPIIPPSGSTASTMCVSSIRYLCRTTSSLSRGIS